MWLLSTSRAELHQFLSPEAIPGPYAVLSHVWGKKEQSFEDTRRLETKCRGLKASPRDYASSKIRESCILAEQHGYDWLWSDGPCIDKSSSAAVSEAINSMYVYYSRAEVCYAYLKDVPPGDIFDERIRKAFRESQWHQRGWTLQELIAPRIVIFLSQDWKLLGTKAELADLIEAVTQIPESLLRLETQLASFSIAQRMSWAAHRQTTREEDKAYSLLGIFGIQIPPLYGEGRQSFYRLQEEIMKRFHDTTLFAWQFVSSRTDRALSSTFYHHNHSDDTYLFAPSPLAFCNSSQMRFSPPPFATRRSEDFLHQTTVESDTEPSPIPTLSVTPYGVLAHIPVIELPQGTIAIFFWMNKQDHLGLRLSPCSSSIDSSRLLYDVFPGDSRLVPLSVDENDYIVDGHPVHAVWKKLYIAHRPPPDTLAPDASTSLYIPLNLGVLMPFRVPGGSIHELHVSTGLRLASVSPMTLPWTGSSPVTLTFEPDNDDTRANILPGIELHLGRCTKSVPVGQAPSGRHLGPHWARLVFHDLKYMSPHGDADDGHSCSEDHVEDWPQSMKVIQPPWSQPDGISGLLAPPPAKLCCTPCPLNPGTTLVVEFIVEEAGHGENDRNRGPGGRQRTLS
ncbi:hypothetical protein GSI_01279 [Ganoderma sinense ZZ0214-1]|uniref:Uncharacterized protein n=1 Tax=Ganoderma sinense ZZ0214-1 TaxID=1077348 RepID=A0A2G8SUY3_9APHY|nr:hypothetical protein GSI_01279 [Ganoderma sinense ZZ0214-1]